METEAMTRYRAIFLINLLQDVNILRPLVFLANTLEIPVQMIVTAAFEKRDRSGIWGAELQEMSLATGATIATVDTASDAIFLLQDAGGIIFAGSESSLDAHRVTHDILQTAPRTYVTVTLQHGFECVGFLQSREHQIAHGREVTFAADVVCGWADASRLTSLAASQRDKLIVAGPTSLLQQPFRGRKIGRGMICENLHSVRFSASGDFKADFMSVFSGFCASMAELDRKVTLRPHPGGQYVLRNKVRLPTNVVMNNQPIYKVDLSRYSYGISAPSSILIDFLLADIPTAVWSDRDGDMDTGNYTGLTRVSTQAEWLEFAREAESAPEHFLRLQRQFLDQARLQIDPDIAYRAYADLMMAAIQRAKTSALSIVSSAAQAADSEEDLLPAQERKHELRPLQPLRVLFVANAMVETLQICILQPLSPFLASGEIVSDLLTEDEIRRSGGDGNAARADWTERRLAAFDPDIVLFCRYSGPAADVMTDWARRNGVSVLFHLDDDLLNIPRELGEAKFKSHNAPERLKTVRHLLSESDLVYCSTRILMERLKAHGLAAPLVSGAINASATVLAPATLRPVRTVGYMGSSSHGADFAMIAPALAAYLREFPEVGFELFGAIPLPAELEAMSDRILRVSPVRGYQEFMSAFAQRQWDIGLCPLLPTPFNLCKSNLKWLDYTAVGAAVISSAGTVYDSCCDDGCGILVSDSDSWLDGLRRLTRDPHLRHEQVLRAQQKLRDDYSLERHSRQVLQILASVFERTQAVPPGWLGLLPYAAQEPQV